MREAYELGGVITADSSQADATIDGFEKRLARSAESMTAQLTRVGATMTAAFTVPLGILGKLGLGFDAMREQAQIAFTTMLGSAEAATAYLDDLAKFAARTPFEFPDLVQAAQRMMAMGFSADDVLPKLTAIGDAVAALGGTGEVVNRVTIALGQMMAKGKVSAQEMMQLTEAGIPAWKYLAEVMGVDVAKAMETVEKNTVGAKGAIDAIVLGMSTDFAGMMEAQSQTLNGLISTIKDTTQQILGSVLMPLFVALKDALSTLANDLLPKFKAWWDGLPEPVQQTALALGLVLAAAGPLALALAGLSTVLGALASPIGVIVLAVGGLTAALISQKEKLSGWGDTIRAVLQNVRDRFSADFWQMKADAQAALEAIKDIVGTIGAWIQDFWARYGENILQVTGLVWSAIVKVLGSALSIIKDLLKTFAALIKGDWDGVQKNMASASEKFWTMLVTLWKTAMWAVLNLLEVWIGIAQRAWRWVWDELNRITGGRLQAIADYIREGFLAIAGFFNGGWKSALENTRDSMQNIVLAIGRGIQDAANAIAAFMEKIPGIGPALAGALRSAGQTAMNLAQSAANWIGATINTGITALENAQEWVKETLAKWTKAIKDFKDDAPDFGSIFGIPEFDPIKAIKDAAKNAKDAVKEIVQQAAPELEIMAKDVKEKIKKGIAARDIFAELREEMEKGLAYVNFQLKHKLITQIEAIQARISILTTFMQGAFKAGFVKAADAAAEQIKALQKELEKLTESKKIGDVTDAAVQQVMSIADAWERVRAVKLPAKAVAPIIEWLRSFAQMVTVEFAKLDKMKVTTSGDFAKKIETVNQALSVVLNTAGLADKLASFKWPKESAGDVIAWLRALAGMTAQAVTTLMESKSWSIAFPKEFAAWAANLSAAFGPLSTALDFAKKLEGFKWPGVQVSNLVAWLRALSGMVGQAVSTLMESKGWSIAFPKEFSAWASNLAAAFGPLSTALDFAKKLEGFKWPGLKVQNVIDWLAALAGLVAKAVRKVKGWDIGNIGQPFVDFATRLSSAFGPLSAALDFAKKLEGFKLPTSSEGIPEIVVYLEQLAAHVALAVRRLKGTGLGNIGQPFVDFAQRLQASFGPLSAAADLAKKFADWKWPKVNVWMVVDYLTALAASVGEAVILLKNDPRLKDIDETFATFAANLAAGFAPLSAALDFITNLRAWKWTVDIGEKFEQFKEIWVNITIQFEALRKRVQDFVSDETEKFGRALGSMAGGLSAALRLLKDASEGWKQPADAFWNNLERFVVDLFSRMHEFAQRFDTDELGVTGIFGQAVGNLFSGLQSALEIFRGLQSYIPLLDSRIDNFLNSVKFAFERMADYARQELVQAGNAAVLAFGEASQSLFSSLSTALSLFETLANDTLVRWLEGNATPGSAFQRAVAALIEAVSATIGAFKSWVYSPDISEFLGAANDFTTAVNAVFETLRTALNVFVDLREHGMPSVSEIQIFLDAVTAVVAGFVAAISAAQAELTPVVNEIVTALGGIGLGGGGAGALAASTPGRYEFVITRRYDMNMRWSGDVPPAAMEQIKTELMRALREGS